VDPGGLLRRFIPSAKARREEARVDASPGGRPLPLPPVSGQRTAGIPPIYMRRVHGRLPVHRPFLLTQLELPAPPPCLPGQRHQGPGGPAKSTRLLLPPPPFQTRPAATSSLLHAYAAPHPPRQPASQSGCKDAEQLEVFLPRPVRKLCVGDGKRSRDGICKMTCGSANGSHCLFTHSPAPNQHALFHVQHRHGRGQV